MFLLLTLLACADVSAGTSPLSTTSGGITADILPPPVPVSVPPAVEVSLPRGFDASSTADMAEAVEAGFELSEDLPCEGGKRYFGAGRSAASGLPPALARWCVRSVRTRPAATRGNHVAVGASGSAPFNAEFTAAVGRADAQDLLHATGAVSVSQLRRGATRLAILDTSPTTGSVVQRPSGGPREPFGTFDRGTTAEHGTSLANIAARLLCYPGGAKPSNADTRCLAAIGTRLALSVTKATTSPVGMVLTRDLNRGGSFGTILDLASAVHDETLAWLETHRDATGLVLNISAGFDPRWQHPDASGQAAADSQMLYDAILRARCAGAIIIAAEGNADHPAEGGHMLVPAAWGMAGAWVPGPAPESASCGRYMPDGVAPTWTGSASLVYPVGGVTGTGAYLPNALRAERSPLRAYGNRSSARMVRGAWQPTESKLDYATSLTGSSVAALVTSSAATARWAAGPASCAGGSAALGSTKYPAEAVMADLSADCSGGGTRAKQNPELRAPLQAGGDLMVVRVGFELPFCSATAGPRATDCATSPDPSFTPQPRPKLTSGPNVDVTCARASGIPTSCLTGPPALAEAMTCGATSFPTDMVMECAGNDPMSVAAHPYVLPQPSPPYCMSCFFESGSGKLWLENAPISSGSSPTNGALELTTVPTGGGSPTVRVYTTTFAASPQFYTFANLDLTGSTATSARILIYQSNFQTSCMIPIRQP